MTQCCLRRFTVLAFVLGGSWLQGPELYAADLRHAAPPEAYMVIWGTKNPERDYLKVHEQAVWDEIAKSKIIEKTLQIVQSHMSDGDAAQFLAIKSSLQNALAPVQWDKVANASEAMYAQKIEGPTSLHLMMIRIPDDGAESLRQGVENLFRLASDASQGKLPVATEKVAGVDLTYLQLPAEVPMTFQPAIGVKGDILIFTTSLNFAKAGLELLGNPSASSKFDDPRLVDALTRLPAPEDALFFFDGKQLMTQLHQIPNFITRMSNGDPQAARATGLITELINQCSAFDYEVNVQYTEGFQQKTAAYGKFSENAGETVLGRMLINQQPFENWKSLVPADSVGFSLNSGCNLLPLYDWAMKEIPARFPEIESGLEKFAAVQNQHDIHVREDILQSFTGEVASVSIPGPATPFGKRADSVMMLRCTQPEHMEELIHRGINELEQIPAVKQQGISFDEVPGHDGFLQLKANALAMAQVAPVIGFKDGWMILGSKVSAIEAVFAAKNGEAATWAEGDRFKEFAMSIDGPVSSVSFTNTGENIRAMSQAMQQLGMMAPMFIGMAQGQAKGEGAEALQVVQELAGLLPSIGRIIGKLDFYDATLSVTQPGPETNSYVRSSVTLIRPPAAPKDSGTAVETNDTLENK